MSAPESVGVYERLGVRPVINGVGTVTRLGGSLMPPPVLEAMLDAARHYVPLEELQAAAGRRLAELTHNEGAYVSSGAAAGLVLATAACITGDDPEKMALLPHPERIPGGRHKVVIQRCQRIGYDFAIRQVGVELVEVGPTRAEARQEGRRTRSEDLEAALDDRTAAVFFIAGPSHAPGALTLEEVVATAHGRGIPVVVDAAAQIPPIENLWAFTGRGGPAPWARALASLGLPEASPTVPDTVPGAGADLALFSGGKGLCGPQATGLVVGRADLIRAMARQANPNALIGRPMKVGKEEICGLVAAVEWYLGLDLVALAARYERQVQHVLDAVAGLPGVTARRDWPNEAGQPMPRALISLGPGALLDRDALQERLRRGDPPVELSNAGGGDRGASGAPGVYVNPQDLREGDEVFVAAALQGALDPAGAAPGLQMTGATS
jgi:seryl-tRNA(Sec) selenium transferase